MPITDYFWNRNSVKELSDIADREYDTEEQIIIKQEIENKESQRKNNYKNFWRLYKGLHWDEIEMDLKKPTPVVNKCFSLINKSICFLVGKSPSINYVNEVIEDILSPYVNLLLKNSGGIQFFVYEAVQMGSVTGDCFIKSLYDPNLGSVILQVQDSEDIDVKYPFRDYQNDRPSVARISWYFINENEKNKISRYEEFWNKFMVDVYIDNVKQIEKSGNNLLGEVPLVHIKNMICGKDTYGMSDILQLEPLNKILNSQMRRFMDDTDFHGDPTTLLFGARIGSLEKGEGKMWGNLPLKARVENLTLDTDFPAQQKFMEYIENSIHEIGSIPKESVSGNKAISNTSAVALHMNNMPIVELTDRKKVTYGKGFRQAIMAGLKLMYIIEKTYILASDMNISDRKRIEKMLGDYKPIGIVKDAEYIQKYYSESKDPFYRQHTWNDVDIKFADYLPKDKLIQMQIIREKMTLNLLSRRGALRELGVDNIDRVIEEINKEMVEMADIEMSSYQPVIGGGAEGMLTAAETPKGAAKQEKGE